jgi:hypothetical protein
VQSNTRVAIRRRRNNFINPSSSISSQEQIMQRATTHQGLERVLLMYALLSRIIRRVAGTLAITQKAR